MKQRFILTALAAVFALGFVATGVSAAEQAADPQATWAEFDAKMRPIMDQMHQKRSELAGLYNAQATVDQAKVQSLYREIADLQAQAYAVRQEYAQWTDGTCPYNRHMGPGYRHGGGMGMGMGMGGHGMGMGYGGYGHRGGGRGGWGGGHHGGRW